MSSLQFLLARAGHLRLLEVDGHFGASTKAGLLRFQRTRGLARDGIAGPATLTAFGHGRRTPVLTKATSSTISYVVRPGDTLTEIAAKHKTTVRALAAANDIESVNLVVEGAKLRLPAAVASAPRTRAQPLDRARAHRQVGGVLRHFRQPRPRARVAGVRLPDERDLVDRGLGTDADHAGHVDLRRNGVARANGAADGRGRRPGRDGAAQPSAQALQRDQRLALAAWYRASGPSASTGSTQRRSRSSRTCSRSPGGRSNAA